MLYYYIIYWTKWKRDTEGAGPIYTAPGVVPTTVGSPAAHPTAVPDSSFAIPFVPNGTCTRARGPTCQ